MNAVAQALGAGAGVGAAPTLAVPSATGVDAQRRARRTRCALVRLPARLADPRQPGDGVPAGRVVADPRQSAFRHRFGARDALVPAGRHAGHGYLLSVPPDPRAAHGRAHARQAHRRRARAHARRPGADGRRAAHAQCVSHHRLHAGVLRGGTAIRVFLETAPAPRRSRRRHGDRHGTRAVPRKARTRCATPARPIPRGTLAGGAAACRGVEPAARQRRCGCTRRGRRLPPRGARARRRAPRARS